MMHADQIVLNLCCMALSLFIEVFFPLARFCSRCWVQNTPTVHHECASRWSCAEWCHSARGVLGTLWQRSLDCNVYRRASKKRYEMIWDFLGSEFLYACCLHIDIKFHALDRVWNTCVWWCCNDFLGTIEVDNKMTIAQEEIFGPVLSIIPYNSEEAVWKFDSSSIATMRNYMKLL